MMDLTKKNQRFRDLPKKDKVLRLASWLLVLIQITLCVVTFIIYFPSYTSKSIGVAFLTLIPFILELIIRRRWKAWIFFFYQVYIFLAITLGLICSFYQIFEWYDYALHITAGYLFSVVALGIMSQFKSYKQMSVPLRLFFCFGIAMMVCVGWEIYEWLSDLIRGTELQDIVVPGYGAPLVTDTMQDMCCNVVGALIWTVQYAIGKCTKCDMAVSFIEKQFCFTHWYDIPGAEPPVKEKRVKKTAKVDKKQEEVEKNNEISTKNQKITPPQPSNLES